MDGKWMMAYIKRLAALLIPDLSLTSSLPLPERSTLNRPRNISIHLRAINAVRLLRGALAIGQFSGCPQLFRRGHGMSQQQSVLATHTRLSLVMPSNLIEASGGTFLCSLAFVGSCGA
jgi:hypothetical protein